MDVTFHINETQPHQVEHAQWFRKGLEAHGIQLKITSCIIEPADIHIVSGPHYAASYWAKHNHVIAIDRCYYRDSDKPSGMASMPDISIGWLRRDGGRQFTIGSGRTAPYIKASGAGQGRIFLADYSGPTVDADGVRLHPSRAGKQRGLIDDLRRYHTAIGFRTSALVTAGLEGLEIDCRDKRNIMSEPNWLELLPYADWNYKEIESGGAWQHLVQSLNP